jgi:hypothetical protein
MENKKYQIFVSSTYKDLIDARTKVISTILSMYHFPIGMEMYSADDDEQWQVIKETIDISDYYIVIVGHRYGSLTKEGISFTEKEFLYAREKGIPILSFIRERDVPTKPEERESDPQIQTKLDEFIEKAKSNKMCDFWKNEDELGAKVAVAISKYFSKRPRVGWKRSDSIASPEILEELAKLSKENRDLREELSSVYQQMQSRKPALSVEINDSTNFTIEFEDNLVRKIDKAVRPSEIHYHLLGSDLVRFVDKNEVEKYNEILPSKEEVEQYNYLSEVYIRLKETPQEIKIGIINSGTMKATDIHIDLEIPDGLIFISDTDLNILEKPKIKLPKNPIEEAKNKMIAYQKGIGHFAGMAAINSMLSQNSNLNMMSNLFGNSKLDVEDIPKSLSLSYKSLLHTRVAYFDYWICPLKRGEYTLIFQIICDEYTSRELSKIIVNVI